MNCSVTDQVVTVSFCKVQLQAHSEGGRLHGGEEPSLRHAHHVWHGGEPPAWKLLYDDDSGQFFEPLSAWPTELQNSRKQHCVWNFSKTPGC